jgi:hypothetical protein
VPHELTPANQAKRVEDARPLSQALRSDPENHFTHMMTCNESWFYYGYQSPTILRYGRDEVIARVSETTSSKKAMMTILLLALDY